MNQFDLEPWQENLTGDHTAQVQSPNEAETNGEASPSKT